MRRSAELRDLSEDHHQGLVQARRLRRATSGEGGELVEVSRTFLRFWQRDVSAHFRREEEVLLPVLAKHGGDLLDRKQVVQMLLQHARIRGLVMQLSDEVEHDDVKPESLQTIGERLEAHIRMEERDVFPMVEETLSEEELGEVASRLVVKETGPHAELWVSTEGLYYGAWPGPGDSEGGGWDYITG